MRPPPSLARFHAYPVITMVSLAAIFVTGAVMFGKTELDPFVVNSLAFEGEPWRLASSALPHGGLVHLLFNIYWLWILGTILEDELGHLTTLILMIVLAASSAAAQYAFSGGGIGLSGVGYGIVGFLAAARRINPSRFGDAMDTRTLQLFVVWFFICIVLTLTNTMPVANWAHGAGFVLGIPLAYTFLTPLPRNVLGIVVTLALCAAFVVGAWQFREKINLSSHAGDDDRVLATREIEEKNYEDAVRHFERALALSPDDDNAWYNYGVALQNAQSHIGMTPIDAWRKALALAPKEEIYQRAVARATWNLGIELQEQGKHDEAEKQFQRAHEIYPKIDEDQAKPDTIVVQPGTIDVTGSGSASTGSAGSAGSAARE